MHRERRQYHGQYLRRRSRRSSGRRSPVWGGKDGKELSLDELEAISGGADRDWLEVGCAATVEPGSWCGSNDWCAIADVTYENSPNKVCPYCGRYSIFIGRVEFRKPGVAHEKKYWCSSCKRIEYVVENPTI